MCKPVTECASIYFEFHELNILYIDRNLRQPLNISANLFQLCFAERYGIIKGCQFVNGSYVSQSKASKFFPITKYIFNSFILSLQRGYGFSRKYDWVDVNILGAACYNLVNRSMNFQGNCFLFRSQIDHWTFHYFVWDLLCFFLMDEGMTSYPLASDLLNVMILWNLYFMN